MPSWASRALFVVGVMIVVKQLKKFVPAADALV